MVRAALAALALAASLAMPAVALGHAVPESSEPRPGAALERPPERVSFTFNEPVEASFGAVRVFDVEGQEVQEGEPFRPGGREDGIAVELEPGLPDGTYTATYRVVSADSHPVSGGLVFTVGDPSQAPGKTISELLGSDDAGPVTGAGFWLVRLLGYLATALALGAAAFAAFVSGPAFRERRDDAEGAPALGRRLRVLALCAVAGGFATSLLSLAFQGAIAGGTDLWRALDPDVIGDVLDTRFGEVVALRSLAWLLLVPLCLVVGGLGAGSPRRGELAAAAASLVPLAYLAVSPGLAGHASTQSPSWLLVPADALHVASMGVWGGGLACLLLALPAATGRLEPERRSGMLASAVTRFSAMALGAVAVLAASGTIQAVVEVGSVPALVETAFGRAVTAKVLVLAALIWLGAANRRRIVPALISLAGKVAPPGGAGVALRRNLRLEVALVVVAIGLAAALVGYPPPGEEPSGPASGSTTVGADRLDYTVDPAQVGANEVHLYLFDDRTGQPVRRLQGLELSFSKPDSEVAPIEAEVRKAGPGHYIAPRAMLAIEGEWQAQVWVRVSRFQEDSATFGVEVR